MPDAGAVEGLGGGEAIRVVFDADLALKRLDQILLDRPSEQPGRARAFAKPALGLERSRYADADAAPASDLAFHPLDHFLDDGDAAEIVVPRRRLAQARQFGPVRLHRDAFDLRSAPIDADQHLLFAPQLPSPVFRPPCFGEKESIALKAALTV